MKIIQPTIELLNHTLDIQKTIELAGRTCYRSEDKVCEGSDAEFIQKMKSFKHLSTLEHGSITMRYVTDRGVMAELTRHRMASFSVESTRYCNYSKGKYENEITVIDPFFFTMNKFEPLQSVIGNEYTKLNAIYQTWQNSCEEAEYSYMALVNQGCSAQEARSVLPNSLATTIVMTANPREWIHVLELRTHRDAHPQIRQIACPTLKLFQEKWPAIFDGVGNIEHPSPAEVI